MKNDIFRTLNGRLTPYALCCGYEEVFNAGGKRVRLYVEHGTLNVRAFDFDNHERIFWECPETLTEARKIFDSMKRKMKKH